MLDATLQLARGVAAHAPAAAAQDNRLGSEDQLSDQLIAQLESQISTARDVARGFELELAAVIAEEQGRLDRLERALGDASGVAECERCLQPVVHAVLAKGRDALRRGAAEAVARRHELQDQVRRSYGTCSLLYISNTYIRTHHIYALHTEYTYKVSIFILRCR